MSISSFARRLFAAPSAAALLFAFFASVHAQSNATLQGRVVDQAGAVVAGAEITALNQVNGLKRVARTDGAGNYQVVALPVGAYRVEIQATGFQTQVVEKLSLEVGRIVGRNFQLKVGDVLQQVTVTSNASLIDQASISVGQVTGQRVVQELPLNGRSFLDLSLLTPGSVTPPQNGFSAVPTRGQGALAVNTAGNREETVNYLVNGITLNNLTFSSISFQPSINTIQE
ncbi:MAG: carboxypeptidase-like regulatory domain-containing protein, partial [Blastocatellia bacterium]